MSASRALVALWIAATPTDLAAIRSAYDFGRYGEVGQLAAPLLASGSLSDPERVELLTYAGLAAFNRGGLEEARRLFAALLRLDPDHALDPFLAPPPARRLFEDVRSELAPALAARRAELASAQAVAVRQQEAARRAEAERQRRELESMARASAGRIEKRSLLVNFVPFGAGQFQQGRVGVGTTFAVIEGMLAIASLATFFAFQDLHMEQTIRVDNASLGGTGMMTVRGVPRQRQRAAEVLRGLNLGTTAALYAVYAGGVVEALAHHQNEVELPPASAPRTRVGVGSGAFVQVDF